MRNTKILKSRCTNTRQAFALEVKETSGTWEVVDFVELTDEQDRKLESQIDVRSICTKTSLLPCPICGNRVVGGCNCSNRKISSCKKGDPYQFQCIYCKKMKLDYSYAADVKDGEKIVLSQGQTITLQHRGNKISKLFVGMGWLPSLTRVAMDLDSSVVLISKDGSIQELVYFGQLRNSNNSIIHHGDNLTGTEKGLQEKDKDDETISISLNGIPRKVVCLGFIVNIYECKNRGQKLKDVRDVHIRLSEEDSHTVLAQYNTFAQDAESTGLIIGMAFRTSNGWDFKARGDSYNVSNVGELAEICASQYLDSCDLT